MVFLLLKKKVVLCFGSASLKSKSEMLLKIIKVVMEGYYGREVMD